VNPRETGGDIHYALDGKLFSLRPGEYHEATVGTAHEVEFHRGNDLGYAKRVIREGVFVFAVDSTGWNLKLEKGSLHLDLRRAN
jgi:hypothetical protein